MRPCSCSIQHIFFLPEDMLSKEMTKASISDPDMMGGGLFNISRFSAKTKVRELTVREPLFADDAALVAHSEESLQGLLDKFSESCKSFGLRISLKKTVIMHQGSVGSNSEIALDQNSLSSVDKFCYLGSPITKNLDLKNEISKRISKAAMNFRLLKKRAWENNRLSTKVKIRIYETCMLFSLLYCSETWTIYARNIKRLNIFHMRCLRKLLRIKWQDKIPDTEVLKRSGLTLLRYHDNCKSDMKSFDMNVDNWEVCAMQRSSWRENVTMGARRYEQALIQRKEESRKRRKQPLTNLDANDDAFTCEHCNKRCRSRIGLFSHIRIHQD